MKSIFLFMVISAGLFGAERYEVPFMYRDIVFKYCAETGIPVYIANSVIWHESRYDTFAISNKSCLGLMQLNPQNDYIFRIYNDGLPVDYFNPDTNVKIGLRFLRDLVKRYGTYRRALYHYNCGNGYRPPRSTVDFVTEELNG